MPQRGHESTPDPLVMTAMLGPPVASCLIRLYACSRTTTSCLQCLTTYSSDFGSPADALIHIGPDNGVFSEIPRKALIEASRLLCSLSFSLAMRHPSICGIGGRGDRPWSVSLLLTYFWSKPCPYHVTHAPAFERASRTSLSRGPSLVGSFLYVAG